MEVTENKDYPDHVSFISTTDRSSYITYANQVFCDIAEYDQQELIGNPHNLVRHADMPKAAFGQLWSYIQEGKSWMGIVKNKCKSSKHYWVSAFVTPIKNEKGEIIEYQSVRSKPTAAQVKRSDALYKAINSGKKVSLSRFPLAKSLMLLSVLVLGVNLFWMWSQQEWLIGSICSVLLIALLFGLAHVQNRLRQLQMLANEAYSNPLLEKVYTGRRDEFSQVELALMMRKAELRAVTARSGDTSGRILQDAQHEFETAKSIEQSLTAQHAETEQVASAVEELTYSINDIANAASLTSELTQEARSDSITGLESIKATVRKVNELDKELVNGQSILQTLSAHTKQVESILDVISSISDQTNLLALNAAIEAARAGESGRGFAVVADEVRHLAIKTSDSTTEIHSMISELQDLAAKGVNAIQRGSDLSQQCIVSADETGGIIKDISAKLEQVSDRSQQIAVAVEQQAIATKEITANAVNIKMLTEKTAQSSGDSVNRTRVLVSNLKELQRLIRQFERN
ncbi:methyl-accepting chemotaxis protein [Vibrio ziniensis]|uniref:Methyl-accepting chemotaxis protein n=1 Tax=Vibrio ziniensis TaxID=2711221 RepID=A0A6G7CNX7_9VIBR|nr:PAS domain-containing methyl-accepting chemotaxis protein [Vibrio ziniensis]QIH43802.1 methyl-accepting chemotaxis protein [Vibrio ziniensis]